MHRQIARALLALVLVAPAAAAADPEVVAVVACDPYADIKKQLRWVGTLVDQPALDGFAESFIMMATQFKGLAGLDVGRPAGVVVTAAGDEPVIHAYVPVKDLGKLLDALQGIVGPVELVDGVRRISPPGGMPLEIVERDGWAIVGPPGAAPAVADPGPLLEGVTRQFTLGAQAFPARMPDGMRRRLQEMVDQAAATAAAQGQPIDQAGLAGLLDNVRQAESVLLGVAVDMDRERVYVESQSRMTPGSPAGGALDDMAKGVVTVASAAAADGKPAALSMHLAMAVPESLRQGAIDGLATVSARDGSDAGTVAGVALMKELLAAMIDAGGYDAAMSVDTSDSGADRPMPALTAGMKVKDGAALETRIKKLVGEAGDVPGLEVAFDSGKAAGANLHTLTLADAGLPGGEPLAVTLAVAPTYVFVLACGDVPARLTAVAGASGKPDANAKPLADVNVALAPVLRYVAALGGAEEGIDAAGLTAAADVADAQDSALVQLLARPIQRGMALRLSADAGAIRTVAASVKPQARAGGPMVPGVPATGGPDPIPFPIPAQ